MQYRKPRFSVAQGTTSEGRNNFGDIFEPCVDCGVKGNTEICVIDLEDWAIEHRLCHTCYIDRRDLGEALKVPAACEACGDADGTVDRVRLSEGSERLLCDMCVEHP